MSLFKELIPLGTNGFYSSYGRQTMSFLLLGSGRALLLDAGTGTARLGEPEIRRHFEGPEAPKRLDIVLSHYHLDHIVGLTYLGTAWQGPVRLFGPAPPLVDSSPRRALDHLLSAPLGIGDLPIPIEVEAYDADFEIDGVSFWIRRQEHPGGSVGLRLDNQIAYVTDTVADAETVELVRGVGMLLHDCWTNDELAAAEPRLIAGHSTIESAIEIAERAEVAALAPVHHHPRRGPAALARLFETVSNDTQVRVVHLVEGESYAL